MKLRVIAAACLLSVAAGCAGVAPLPAYSGPARNFLEGYLEVASEPGHAGRYFKERANWKRLAALERENLNRIVKKDREGATQAFHSVLAAAEIEWRNMEYFLRPSTRNNGEAKSCQRAAIADLNIAHDIVTAIADAFGEEAAGPLREKFRKLAKRLDPE